MMALEFEFPNVPSGCGVIDELTWSYFENCRIKLSNAGFIGADVRLTI